MKFNADFHIHSRYSIATSKTLTFESLHIAAQKKGITVVGTGDITHPEWLKEAEEKLVTDGRGLFRLRKDIASVCDMQVPERCRAPVRFLLTAEVSNIYKKEGKTRKNHNLIFLPDLDTTKRFNRKLDKIGNIKSDGRPILGLDARNLLEILLETSDQAYLVPAHIWTPWFSVLGSKSGFDSISECFGDLTAHIFAVETGLSSDPAMNRRVTGLDDFTLISNSDAHSAEKLGREANQFNTELDFFAIKNAMAKADPGTFLGTIEFHPEEGKYHMDGHRKCRVWYTPEETMDAGGGCPVCGKPLTLGVLYRVEELADRGRGKRPPKSLPFFHLVPLTDILSEILASGPATKRVKGGYHHVISALGNEIQVLHELPVERIEQSDMPLLGEAIRRMRRNEIHISPGYDGEFGKIRFFSPQERRSLTAQKSLFLKTEKKGAEFSILDEAHRKSPIAGAGGMHRKRGQKGLRGVGEHISPAKQGKRLRG